MMLVNNKFIGDDVMLNCFIITDLLFVMIYFQKKNVHTSPEDDFDINHFESFLCEDFLISRVTPGGLQGNK